MIVSIRGREQTYKPSVEVCWVAGRSHRGIEQGTWSHNSFVGYEGTFSARTMSINLQIIVQLENQSIQTP